MAKRAAGRVRWDPVWLLRVLMSVLVLERFQLIAGLLQVEMAGRTQMVFLNENVTIFCKIHDSPHLDIKSMGITWFQKTGKSETYTKLFQYFGNYRETSQRGAWVSLRSLQKGDASLQLPRVQLEDAGEYRCELVVTPQKAQGSVWLEVVGDKSYLLRCSEDYIRSCMKMLGQCCFKTAGAQSRLNNSNVLP